MLAHPPDRGRERLGEDQIAEHLGGVVVDLVDGSAFVAAVEEAQEVTAVETVELEQRGSLEHLLGDEPHAIVATQSAGRQPRIRRDDVRCDERVLEIERGEVTIGGEDLRAQPIAARLRLPSAGRRLDACLGHDAGQVDVVDVGVPVDDARIERIGSAIVVVERVPQREQSIEPVDRFALGVRAVELDVAEGAVDEFALLFEGGAELGLLAPYRQQRQQTLGPADARLGPPELLLHASSPGEAPLGDRDGLAAIVIDRVLGEPALHEIDQAPVAQRVDRARRHLHDIGALGRGRTARRDRADRGDDEIDGDDVDDAFGNTGELVEQPAPVGEDDRLGHAKAANPAGKRLGERRLDDRRSHDRHRHVAARVDERALADRLGERVRIGEAERRRAGAPAATMRSVTHLARSDSVLSASSGVPAAPSSWRADLRNLARRSGVRLAVSASRRARRAASTSCRQSTSTKNGLSSMSSSGAAPRRLPAT